MDHTKTRLDQAKSLYAHGKLAESEEAFRQLLHSGNDTAEVFYYIGLIHVNRRDWRGAVDQLEHAIKRDPRHANALYQLGFVAEHRGNLQEAVSYYRKAQSARPGHVGAQQRLEKLLDRYVSNDPPADPRTDSPITNAHGQDHTREASRQAAADAPGRTDRDPRARPPGGEAESQPRLSQQPSRSSGPATSPNSPVVGVVRRLQARAEPVGWIQMLNWTVWSFLVEHTDEAGNPLPPVAEHP